MREAREPTSPTTPMRVRRVAWRAARRPVHAQVSGSVGVVSDYRYRGYSLSDGDPAVQASVA